MRRTGVTETLAHQAAELLLFELDVSAIEAQDAGFIAAKP
jgi:hypothetical protein